MLKKDQPCKDFFDATFYFSMLIEKVNMTLYVYFDRPRKSKKKIFDRVF